MWRDYLGPHARIIGIDANPGAEKWRGHGFEIYIGDQSDPDFWARFFQEVGDIDVLLDDGGHTYLQQIATVRAALPWIRDDGVVLVEDTHTSGLPQFGAKKYSFMNWALEFANSLNQRSSVLSNQEKGFASKSSVWHVSIFESIVCFHVNGPKAAVESKVVTNQGEKDLATDFRYADESNLKKRLLRLLSSLNPVSRVPLFQWLHGQLLHVMRLDIGELRRHFKGI